MTHAFEGVGSSGFMSPHRRLAVPKSGREFVDTHALFFAGRDATRGGTHGES